jgi:hypothetical protein
MRRNHLPVPASRAATRLSGLLLLAFVAGLCATASAAAGPSRLAHGHVIQRVGHAHLVTPRGVINTNTSGNWFGYNQGSLEKGGKLFNSITGEWTVPTASQHTANQAESSADWIGIGGGCVDSGCTVGDQTLIQTGTEQDVAANGSTSYDAWYEIIPAPELLITNMTVNPGDRMFASIAQLARDVDVWTITLKDLSNGQSYSTTVPYPSTMDTAEWIEETPLEIGTNAGLASLPNLTSPAWDNATVNGAPANLTPSEAVDLTDSSGHVIAVPSAPDSDNDGFNECTWAGTCTAPSSS